VDSSLYLAYSHAFS